MNSNDKISLLIKRIEPFKPIEFDQNPSTKFLIIFIIIICSIFLFSLTILITSWIIEAVKKK